ncbi:MAG: hypothetical protein ACRDBL_09530 [Rhabdaerophilum sp.]
MMDASSAMIAIGALGFGAVMAWQWHINRQKAVIGRFQQRFSALTFVRPTGLSCLDFVAQAHATGRAIFGGSHPDLVAYEDAKPAAAQMIALVRASRRACPEITEVEHLAAALVVFVRENGATSGNTLDIRACAPVFPAIIISGMADNSQIAKAYALIYDAASPSSHP